MKDNYWLFVLLGIPISIMWMKSASMAYTTFDGKTWPMRFIGFSIGILVFTLFSRIFLHEVITMKTMFCIGLSVLILIIQVWF